MSPTWSSSKKEREHLTKRIADERKIAYEFLKRNQEYKSALWFIKSLVESSISHPDTSYDVIEKISDKIEDLDLKARTRNDNSRK